MQPEEIKQTIRDIITDISGVPGEEIGDATRFVEELDLDSLAMLEIGVDIDHAFKLGLPDERFKELRCLDDAVALVTGELATRKAAEVA